MNDISSTNSPCTARTQTSRPTIALCGAELDFHIPVSYLTAASALAQAADMNFLYFSSQPVDTPYYFEIQANMLYAMLEAAKVDGLLIASNLVGLYHSPEETSAFFQRYRPVPMVSMGGVLDGIPSLIVDNFTGMYAAVSHLINIHGYRRIAFLGGVRENQEAQERYRAYTTALADHGIPLDEGLVVHGNFQGIFGPTAVQTWVDERGYRPHHDIEAIVAANDYMAIGVLLELQKRGIAVPEEVAIVGFDDIVIGRTFTPPLTTVRQPFDVIGQQAMEILLATLDGQSVPDVTQVPAQLVVRQSCGCAAAETGPDAVSLHRSPTTGPLLWESPRQFFQHLNQVMYATENSITVDNMEIWEDALSLLHHEQPGRGPATATAAVDEAASRTRAVLAEMMRLSLQEKREAQILNQLGECIISTLNIAELMDVLAEGLPQLGIRSGYVALYENPPAYDFPQPLPSQSRLVLAYDEQGRRSLPQQGLQFPTHEILPHSLWAAQHARGMVVEALYFQREQIGFAVLEVGAQEGTTYGVLRRYLSTSLQGALLIERVQRHAHELAAAYEEIRLLNEQLKEENIRMGMELDVARRLQEMILPKPEELQQIEGLDIVGYMKPADEVGGDYYDVLKENGILHIGIGDVTGHGLESGVLMLMTQTTIRTLIEHGETDPVALVNTLNRTIYKNARRMGADKTLTFALINYQGGQVKIVGQHEEMLVVRKGGQIERVDTIDLGFSIGLVTDIDQWIAEATVRLEPGDGVVLYTDGIPEAENIDKTFYGIERLCEVISSHWDRSAEEIKQAVVDDVTRHIGKQKVYDDLTLVVLKQQ